MRPEPKSGVLGITAYQPGRSTARGFASPIKLSANENPLGCSEAARQAYLNAAGEIHLYPDANTSRLRAAIAEKYELAPERLVFGAGSDEIFSVVCQAYLGAGDTMVQPKYGFAAWAIAARAAGGQVRLAPERHCVVDVEALLAAVDDRTKVVFLANPANPTGTWLEFEDVARLHAALPSTVLLVLDGAYAECATGLRGFADGLDWSKDKDNVIVTRTFSKIYGLASLRIGWAYVPEHVAEAVNRIRLPFSISRAGEAAAVAALDDDAFVQRSIAHAAAGRRALAEGLSALGLRTLPSATNFVTACFDGAKLSASDLERALRASGILVRHLANYGMLDWLRFSVGREQDDALLLATLRVLLRHDPPVAGREP